MIKGANWVSLQVSATGQDGREVELRNNGTYIQWRYVGEDDNAWRNLAALSDLVGPAGRPVPMARMARTVPTAVRWSSR